MLSKIKTLLWQFLLNEKQSGKVAGVDRFRTPSSEQTGKKNAVLVVRKTVALSFFKFI